MTIILPYSLYKNDEGKIIIKFKRINPCPHPIPNQNAREERVSHLVPHWLLFTYPEPMRNEPLLSRPRNLRKSLLSRGRGRRGPCSVHL